MTRGLFAAMLASLLACGGSTVAGNDAGGGGWAGSWSCSFSFADEGMMGSGTSEVNIAQGSNGLLTITPVSDAGGPGCDSLLATVASNSATFATVDASQPCQPTGQIYGGKLLLMGNTFAYTFTEMQAGQALSSSESGSCTRM
jgi:hypothetical protein